MNYVNANYDALNTKFKKFKKEIVIVKQRIKKTKILKKKRSKTLIKNESIISRLLTIILRLSKISSIFKKKIQRFDNSK